MKKGCMCMFILLIITITACSGKSIEERSFTYYDSTYGKFYLEVDNLLISDINDIITLTMKYTASQSHTFYLDTLDEGKAGMMSAELRYLDKRLYTSDDVPKISEGGIVSFDINEKVFRNIMFSIMPFHDVPILMSFPNGTYTVWLYVDGSLIVETDICITVDI